jgi:hypothetical protein
LATLPVAGASASIPPSFARPPQIQRMRGKAESALIAASTFVALLSFT